MDMADNLGGLLKKLDMYPYFDVAHYILCCLMVKEDYKLVQGASSNISSFSRTNPLASWVSSMMLCFAGAIVGNILIGESLIAFLNDKNVLIASGIWYIVNYSPFDITFKCLSITPCKIVIIGLKEIHRVHKVHQAVNVALKQYPQSYFIVLLLSCVKGAAGNLIRPFQRLVLGYWNSMTNEFLKPTFITKASLLLSYTFLLEKKGYLSDFPSSIIFLSAVLFLLVFRLLPFFLPDQRHIDPFAPIEAIVSFIFLGGLWDAITGASTVEQEVEINSRKNSSTSSATKKQL